MLGSIRAYLGHIVQILSIVTFGDSITIAFLLKHGSQKFPTNPQLQLMAHSCRISFFVHDRPFSEECAIAG